MKKNQQPTANTQNLTPKTQKLTPPNSDEYFMRIALSEAQKAYQKDEVPIGAVIVLDNQIIAKAHNQTETLQDPTAHAEILAITTANQFLSSKYLNNAKLYVTLEPCLMCSGAIFWSKLSHLIFGAFDEKNGFTKTQNNLKSGSIIHKKLTVKSRILETECVAILQDFFKNKRLK